MNPQDAQPIDLRRLIREHPGKRRCDLTPLFGHPDAFRQAVLRMTEPFRAKGVTKVAGLEGMGLALAGAAARELRSGVVLFRKPGLLAWDARSIPFTDYSGEEKAFEMASDALSADDRVLVVDDWTETGSQLLAAFQLIEGAGAEVVGAALVNVDPAVRRDPRFRGYFLHAILGY